MMIHHRNELFNCSRRVKGFKVNSNWFLGQDKPNYKYIVVNYISKARIETVTFIEQQSKGQDPKMTLSLGR